MQHDHVLKKFIVPLYADEISVKVLTTDFVNITILLYKLIEGTSYYSNMYIIVDILKVTLMN